MCKTGAPRLKLGWLLLAFLWAGCSTSQPVFPGADAVPGWTRSDAVEVFDQETLFSLVDGQAESYFAYGFEQVAVGRFESAGGEALEVEVWQLATPFDAYGLFTASAAGTAVAIGDDGDTDPGRRVVFWQDRYYVHVRTWQELPAPDLNAFAEGVSRALPSAPYGQRPALVDRLPPDGLAERGVIFFHEEISIYSELWLGGENLLGLSAETDGVLARYDAGGAVARLLLVQYPDAAAAADALGTLTGRQDAGELNLISATVREGLLGAVFGDVDAAAADALLQQALDNQ